jgi:medium-chain acyl-[acyl-carrier-protein] hydrolase
MKSIYYERVTKTADWRLFCLPHAGAGASVYRTWARNIPRTIDVVPIQIPGRENRLSEPLAYDAAPLAAELAEDLLPLFDRPFAFFGHSLGAALALEICRVLAERWSLAPQFVFVSGRKPCPVPASLPSDEILRAAIRRRFNNSDIAEQGEIVSLLLPILRADLTVASSVQPYARLSCPMAAVAGEDDPHVAPRDLAQWESFTTGQVIVRMFPGGHLYLEGGGDVIARWVGEMLSERSFARARGHPTRATSGSHKIESELQLIS